MDGWGARPLRWRSVLVEHPLVLLRFWNLLQVKKFAHFVSDLVLHRFYIVLRNCIYLFWNCYQLFEMVFTQFVGPICCCLVVIYWNVFATTNETKCDLKHFRPCCFSWQSWVTLSRTGHPPPNQFSISWHSGCDHMVQCGWMLISALVS